MARKPASRLRKPAYFKWRDGRPRWEPGPVLRAAGFAGRNLKSESGDWLPLYRAMEAAQALNDEVAVWRAGGGGRRHPPPSRKREHRTGQALYDNWINSPKFLKLRDSTKADYQSKVRVFLEMFGDAPLTALSKPKLYAWWEKLYRERGHHMANGCVLAASSMLTYGTLKGWLPTNPALGLRMETPTPRTELWLPEECSGLVAIADEIGGHYAACADAFIIGLHSGQRQGDILDLDLDHEDDHRLRLKQSKRNARVAVPLTPTLRARVATIRARKATHPVTNLQFARRLVLRPDGEPYKPDHFRHLFKRLRDAVALKIPSVTEKTFADTRDTAVTRLAEAECTVSEICSITGHAEQSAHQILRHYLTLTGQMADNAIRKYVAYMEATGIDV